LASSLGPLGSDSLGGTEEQISEKVTILSIKMSTKPLNWNISSSNRFSHLGRCIERLLMLKWSRLGESYFAVFFSPFASGWHCEGTINKIEGVGEGGKERFREWDQVLLLYTFET